MEGRSGRAGADAEGSVEGRLEGALIAVELTGVVVPEAAEKLSVSCHPRQCEAGIPAEPARSQGLGGETVVILS